MKGTSKADDEEANREEAVIHAEPIIVDHPAKPDPKLLDTVLKVNAREGVIVSSITRSIATDRRWEPNLNWSTHWLHHG